MKAVIVTEEHARVSVFSEKNQAVGDSLEPRFHEGRQALSRLRVVIIDKSNGDERVFLYDAVVENFSQVVFFPFFGSASQVKVETDVEDVHVIVGFVKVVFGSVGAGGHTLQVKVFPEPVTVVMKWRRSRIDVLGHPDETVHLCLFYEPPDHFISSFFTSG